MKRLILFLTLALAVAAPLVAQTPIQQSPTRLDAANRVDTNVTSNTTTTLTPAAGEIVYVYEIDISNCAGSTAVGAAATTNITTTGLTGSPIWTLGSGVAAGSCDQTISLNYPTGMKSTTPGANVTFVIPTFATNQTIRFNVAWRSGPPQ